MAQVKKAAVRDAIVDSAYALFRQKGYIDTSISDIAAAAGVSKANIYVYFKSKLEILFAVADPWFRERVTALEDELAGIAEPRDRLRRIFFALWRDIPAEDDGFAHNIMQAVATAWKEEGYDRELLLWSEHRITAMIKRALPEGGHSAVEQEFVSHLMFMAFDGFILNQRIVGPSRRLNGIVEMMVDFLLGAEAPDARRGPRPPV